MASLEELLGLKKEPKPEPKPEPKQKPTKETIKAREGWWKGKGKWIVKPVKADPKKGIIEVIGVPGTGEFVRRSVEVDVTHFCGWHMLKNLVEKADGYFVKSAIATLFESGGRRKEVLTLTEDQFVEKERTIEIQGMKVVKCKPGADVKWRTFPIDKRDPLVPTMMKLVYDTRKNEPGGKIFPYGDNWLYKVVTKTDEKWWCHRFRAERASQLAVERNFDVPRLMKWFGWVRPDTPTRYVRMNVQDLTEAMLKGRM